MFSKFFKKPEGENAGRTPPGQSLTERFPIMTYGPTPKIDPASVKIRVWGAVASELEVTWDELQAMPQVTQTKDLHCVTHWSKLDVTHTGVSVLEVMKRVALLPEATHVMLHCYGGYTTNLALTDFLRPDNIFAHTLEGAPLPIDHGGPLRVIVPHLYIWKSPKWVNGMEFMMADRLGFWERNGYHGRGDPWKEQRYADD